MSTNTGLSQLSGKSLVVENQIKVHFEVIQAGQNQNYLIRKDRVVIGSVESADLKILGADISPIHAVMEFGFGVNESQCTAKILDLASISGVKINGTKVVNAVVKPGDRVQIGEVSFVFIFKKPDPKHSLPDQALLLIEEDTVKPIFDYRPPVKEALEVVYSWNNTILNVKHFVTEEEVILGDSRDHDFVVPPIFQLGNEHRLVGKQNGHWVIHLDQKMKGVLYLNGELHTVESYRENHLAPSSNGTIVLGENDFAKIEAGSVQFYLSQTVSPPVLRKQTTIISDPFLAKSLIGSLLITLLILFGISKMDNPPTEVVQVPETIATILYHPEKYSIKKPLLVKKTEPEKTAAPPEPEKPKKAEIDFSKPKETQGKVAQTKSQAPGKKQAAQSKSKEGEGARAKGAEGSRGSKNAKASSSHQDSANRPSPTAGTGKGGTDSQVADNGNVQMLKGATNKILDLLGGSGQKLGASGSKLSGFGGFTTQGNGGLALQGKGSGGGGTADTLLGGTGEKGRGGGKVGTGLGSEGTGSGIVGGKTRVELSAGGGNETVVVGAIDREAIEAAIRAHKDEFTYCYEREVNAGQPNLAGKINTAFVIGASGRASQMAISASSMGSPKVENCVLSVIGRIQFPQPNGGVPCNIKYPFSFANRSK